jgi:hypothetical protein
MYKQEIVMKFFKAFTTLFFVFVNFNSVNGSVLNSKNTMTCLEFFMSNFLVENGQDSSLVDEEIAYIQYIFDKDVPIYNFTDDYGFEEDIKCLDGKCSIHQKVDDAYMGLQTFKEEGEQFGKHFYSVSSIDFSTNFDGLSEYGITRHQGKMVCEEPLPEFYLIDKN